MSGLGCETFDLFKSAFVLLEFLSGFAVFAL
jgi:hypothetical protein